MTELALGFVTHFGVYMIGVRMGVWSAGRVQLMDRE